MEAHVRNQESHVAGGAPAAKAASSDGDVQAAAHDYHKQGNAHDNRKQTNAQASGDHVTSLRDRDVSVSSTDGQTDAREAKEGTNSWGEGKEPSGIGSAGRSEASLSKMDSDSDRGKESIKISAAESASAEQQSEGGTSPTGKRSGSTSDSDGLDRKMKQATLQQMWSNNRSSQGKDAGGSPSSKSSGSSGELDPDNLKD